MFVMNLRDTEEKDYIYYMSVVCKCAKQLENFNNPRFPLNFFPLSIINLFGRTIKKMFENNGWLSLF